MACIACGRSFHDECEIGCDACHGNLDSITKSLATGSNVKPDERVTDVLSTGRKRAAKLYAHLMSPTTPCEWRGKKNCGGGATIVGCINGFTQDIHHGPDKFTLNNDRDNVHLICKKCHKRWHFYNDQLYERDLYRTTKHEPIEATYEELYSFELQWVKTPRGNFKVEEE
jgi:hypothetical protein